ncbi:MAG: EAL domain-containing protein, partial [Devosia sp.]
MPRFVSLLIDRTRQRYVSGIFWLATFAVVLAMAVVLAGQLVHMRMMAEARQLIEPQERMHQSAIATLSAIFATLTADPCSPAFHEQLRQIAFLPDGFNEFVYVEKTVVRCSVNADFPPHDLGLADVFDVSTGSGIWYDKSLDFLGRPGLTGTILVDKGFGIVVPPQPEPVLGTDWMRFELVDVGPNGGYRHRAGDKSLFGPLNAFGPWAAILPLHRGGYGAISCLPDGYSCVAVTVPLGAVAWANLQFLVLGFLLCALVALGISSQLSALVAHYWSFEARFKRHFKPDSVVCAYQPVLSLKSGRICGCEVLVRWRDVDGALVYPDQFLHVVEKFGLGRLLTQYVMAKAFAELSAQVPADYPLQVNFNVFPRDLDAAWLRGLLQPFELLDGRFQPVVEIVETDLLQAERAQGEIDALRRAGIKTHLDDFGTGYSNIENLARLPVDGVKLDRSFAMAPAGSLMARMLVNAIEMIHTAGHRITVEGVETSECLAMLRGTGQVDFIQGYFISRPVDVSRFVAMLSAESMPVPMRPRVVAG